MKLLSFIFSLTLVDILIAAISSPVTAFLPPLDSSSSISRVLKRYYIKESWNIKNITKSIFFFFNNFKVTLLDPPAVLK